ncbi:hypothetical protein CBM2589_B10192 [Cupriavidus taiwanensis]|uniref:Uncharacterized protein n=1 Tax=Cupriavidus taiwanensis TaxID=164546 RepID=A0A975WNM6_9BURK|nr:hypothetical protein CBM2589_B10192 [Cupriavidus taiwanensis]
MGPQSIYAELLPTQPVSNRMLPTGRFRATVRLAGNAMVEVTPFPVQAMAGPDISKAQKRIRHDVGSMGCGATYGRSAILATTHRANA